MSLRLPSLLAAAVLLLPSVLPAQKVRTDYAHGTDFTKYKTYKWIKISENPDVNQITDQRIVSAIDAQLAQKGLTRTEDNPDLLVGYQAAVTQETQLNTYTSGMGPGWGYGWGSAISTTTTSTILVGNVVVDLMDPQQEQLVFRGIATGTLGDKPEKNAKKLQKAMKKIFEKYPPKA
jgi:hypothetical protein